MTSLELQNALEPLHSTSADLSTVENISLLSAFLDGLNNGTIRSASPTETGDWVVNTWVKRAILLLFRAGKMTDMGIEGFPFFDKHTIPVKPLTLADGVRLVPGGSSIRTGCYVAKGVICMPPMYINIGSYVDEGTMIDSHALVGTCAQIGKNVHLSAASQIGGVLEPAGASPVIIEDDVLIGGNCGIYEGVRVKKRAVLGSGVILTASTPVYDIINEVIYRGTAEAPLTIPEGAVVIPGSRSLSNEFAKQNGLSISAPIIIKYRDNKTDARTALESALR